MKIAFFDIIGGISGDMTLAAFISAGIPADDLSSELQKLNIGDIELEAVHVRRSGIAAVQLKVIASAPERHHRSLAEIFSIIESSSLSESAKDRAKRIFSEVANAEARVHDQPVENIHFHEVGGIDSIVDIVGTAICMERFGIQKVYSTPVKLGTGGFVQSGHGQLPLPSPAAAEILKGYPVLITDIPFESTTPTGAAIIKALSTGLLSAETLRFSAVGYGAGSKEIPNVPNLLRLIVGETPPPVGSEEVAVIEADIDDMNPEIYPFVIQKFLSSGALDAFITPLIMKKGRPGILLSVIAGSDKLDDIVSIFFSQTSTLGVRIRRVERRKVLREAREILTSLGKVTVKAVFYDGRERLIPEYEECRRIASESGIPLIEIYKIVEGEIFSKNK